MTNVPSKRLLDGRGARLQLSLVADIRLADKRLAARLLDLAPRGLEPGPSARDQSHSRAIPCESSGRRAPEAG